MPLGMMNANARRLFNDTCFAQADKGTETAHGTNHRPATRAYSVKFMIRRSQNPSINRAVRPKTVTQTRHVRHLHNTNAQFPFRSLKKVYRGKRHAGKAGAR